MAATQNATDDEQTAQFMRELDASDELDQAHNIRAFELSDGAIKNWETVRVDVSRWVPGLETLVDLGQRYGFEVVEVSQTDDFMTVTFSNKD
jgi:hypothetical protein